MKGQSQEIAYQRPTTNSKTLQKYKKRLLFQVISIFSICLLVILERIFYQVIIQSEQTVLSNFQKSTDLVSRNSDGTTIARQITNGFLVFLAELSDFRIQFLLFTHFFITLYVAIDAYLTTKVLYVSMATIYIISLLQLFYSGARPFWTSSQIFGSSCLANYSHPTMGLVLSLFIPYYTFYCWKKKSGGIFLSNMKTSQMVFFILLFIFVSFQQFMNYFTGLIFLINIALSLVCFLLITMILISLNAFVDKAIKKSTVIKVDAKKYVFYWLLFICLLQTFALIVYSGQDVFLNIDWVKNYMTCTEYQAYDKSNYRYDEVIGPWFNFLQTASNFGWIGAVFGISACYNKMTITEWCGGSTKKRILRAIVANIMIIPSWIFILVLEDGSWIGDIGLNEFIVDGVHFFILYLWLFGYMPIYVLEKGLKLTNKQNEDFYVILQQKK